MKARTLIASFILSLFLFTGVQAQYKVGDVVSDFSLKNVDNKKTRASPGFSSVINMKLFITHISTNPPD